MRRGRGGRRPEAQLRRGRGGGGEVRGTVEERPGRGRPGAQLRRGRWWGGGGGSKLGGGGGGGSKLWGWGAMLGAVNNTPAACPSHRQTTMVDTGS